MKYIPYGRQTIDSSDVEAVVSALQSDYLTQGPAVEQFEQALSAYTSAQHTVVFNSGTAALHASYFALGLQPGDEIITTPITFAATANAALYLGAKPVFCDIIPETGCMDPTLVERLITPKTRLIAPVDYAGLPSNLSKLADIAKNHDIKIVEDACHALGAHYQEKQIGEGTYSDCTIFSFHPVKHITTGEGGALQTNDSQVFEKAMQFRSHGITKNPESYINKVSSPWYHEMQFLGFNYRLTEIQAALGISQLKKLEGFLARRQAIAKYYTEAFSQNQYFELQYSGDGVVHAYHLFAILLRPELSNKKNKLVAKLHERKVGSQVHYIPVYLHPYYQELGYTKGLCPQAELFYERQLSLPIFPSMTDSEVEYVAKTVLDTCKKVF